MEYEEFLCNIYTPLKSIELLSDWIYTKYNKEWNFSSVELKYKSQDELLAINYLIGLCARNIIEIRNRNIEEI